MNPQIDVIVREVSRELEIPPRVICGESLVRQHVEARQVCWAVGRTLGISPDALGDYFSFRQRWSVIHGVTKFKQAMTASRRLRSLYEKTLDRVTRTLKTRAASAA